MRTTRTLAITLLFGAASAFAAVGSADTDARARFERERAACLSGQSHQDRATCMKEAVNAYGEAKRNRLDSGQAGMLDRNAMMRCDPLPVEQREDCRARMSGRGTTSGSVEGGGIYRELITREVGPVEPAR